ncbi:MAG TPA: rhodanese-like domain-containing protein [Bacteroidales bacterium]|nr:rhodanese-like domain-containing protein [Bacteroidales bacterium]
MKHSGEIEAFLSHGVRNLTPGECYRLAETGRITIVDVREEYLTNFRKFGTRGVILLPFSRLVEEYKTLSVDDGFFVFADSAGLKSREAVLYMMGKGYKNVFNMAGGFVEWARGGLPVVTDRGYRLSGSCMCQIKAREKGK